MLKKFTAVIYFFFVFISTLSALYALKVEVTLATAIALFLASIVALEEKTRFFSEQRLKLLQKSIKKKLGFLTRFRKKEPTIFDTWLSQLSELHTAWNSKKEHILNPGNLSTFRSTVKTLISKVEEANSSSNPNLELKNFLHNLQLIEQILDDIFNKHVAQDDIFISKKTAQKTSLLIKECMDDLRFLKAKEKLD